MFDSPIDFCSVCNDMVLLDQTCDECRREHGCTTERCPLRRCFTGIQFSSQHPSTERERPTRQMG